MTPVQSDSGDPDSDFVEEFDAAHLESDGTGDFRGPYGFSRPAHGSDPSATYVFEPRRRTLPPKRWTQG